MLTMVPRNHYIIAQHSLTPAIFEVQVYKRRDWGDRTPPPPPPRARDLISLQ